MKKTRYPVIYRPSPSFRLLVAGAFTLFLAVAGLMIWTEQSLVWVMTSLAMVLIGFLGVAEVLISNIELRPESVRLRGLWRSREIPFAEITRVSGDGGGIAVLLQSGEWVSFPPWLGSPTRSLRQKIAHQVRIRRQAAEEHPA